MKQLKLPDFTMAYDDQGRGLPVLCVHGYPLNRSLWQPQLENLDDVARLIAPDLRGHGDSKISSKYTLPAGGYSMDLFADDCAALLKALKIREPVVFCGLSMGGYVAFSFFRRYPELVRALILVATRAGADTDAIKEARREAIANVLGTGTEAIVESMLPNMLSVHTRSNQPETVQRVAGMMASTPTETIVGDLTGMMNRPNSTPLLNKINVPTLLIFGGDDKIINLWDMNNLRDDIPGAVTRFISFAGHLPNLEQVEVFNQQVRSFLTQLNQEAEA